MNRGDRKGFVTIVLIVLSVVAALIVEVISGSAGASSPPNSTKATGSSTAHLAAPQSGGATGGANGSSTGGVVYHTVGTMVNLRASASTSAPILTVMRDIGSPVTLTCYLRGTSIAGDPWWYQSTFVSAKGYVAGFWVDTGPDPAKTHLPTC